MSLFSFASYQKKRGLVEYEKWLGEVMIKMDRYGVGYGEYLENGKFQFFSFYVPDPSDIFKVGSFLELTNPGREFVVSQLGEYRKDLDQYEYLVSNHSIRSYLASSNLNPKQGKIRLVQISSGDTLESFVDRYEYEVEKSKPDFYFGSPYILDMNDLSSFPFDEFYVKFGNTYVELPSNPKLSCTNMTRDGYPLHKSKLGSYFLYFYDGRSVAPEDVGDDFVVAKVTDKFVTVTEYVDGESVKSVKL
jgi:hypothetical protein